MSILGNNTLPTPPPQPAKEKILKRKVEQIKNLSKNFFNQAVRVQREGIDLVFDDPTLEPQEILDALAPNAAKVLAFHGGLTDYINGVAALDGATVELKQPLSAFTVNLSAGTVTLIDQPYKP